MKKWILYSSTLIIFLASLFFLSPCAFSWGFHAHEKINREAVYALPASMESFYKTNIDYISENAVDPDKRKYVDSSEAQRHFIDIDHYGANAFDVLPKYWKAAIQKYPEDTLKKYGTLPWEVLFWEERLTLAFKDGDGKGILKASAYIGHYIADAHVPLHTISNYNGQKTEQEGIHALWETAIPEALSDKYNYKLGKASYINNPQDKIWDIIRQSHSLAATVLSSEAITSKEFPDDSKFSDKEKKRYSSAYISAYSKALNGMVEKQMQNSVLAVASFWYTAWVNAGQPDLSAIEIR